MQEKLYDIVYDLLENNRGTKFGKKVVGGKEVALKERALNRKWRGGEYQCCSQTYLHVHNLSKSSVIT